MENKSDPWRFINAINQNGKDLSNDPELEGEYNDRFINRSLSYHLDTVILAMMMDKYNDTLSKKIQFIYLLNMVRKQKRFTKFARKDAEQLEKDADVQLIQEYFGCNRQKALAALSILSKEQIKNISDALNKGGHKTKKDE